VKALITAVATLAAYLAPDVASTPRICDTCGRTFTRLTPAQCTQIGSKQLPACRRRRCDGRLWAATWQGTGHLLEDLAAHPTNTTGDNPS
jgi:hypothetical protein